MRRTGRDLVGRVLALLVALALTAFAPAPFPKAARRGGAEALDIASLQGEWRLVSIRHYQGGGKSADDNNYFIPTVRIKGAVWTYVEKGGGENASYALEVKPGREGSSIEFFDVNTKRTKAYMFGLVRRRDGRVQILATSDGSQSRRTTFADPPGNWWLMTLERR